jgi:phage/plasmid-like protein (TIGR03299 family)
MSKFTIVSENHNVSDIQIEIPDFDGDIQREIARLNNRGGGWDAAEYGISREAAIARIREASTPEARAQVLIDLRERAIRRASLDTSNGRVNVMVAGEPAWHRLGVNVSEAVDSKDAAVLSGTNWSVTKKAFSYQFNGSYREQSYAFGIVRDDTGDCLGTVGSRYQPIQNAESFAFLDSVLGQYGAKYETAGSIFGGRKVWMLVKLPAMLKIGGVDEILQYALFTNAHDGSGVALCFPTNTRVVCGNTHRVALRDSDKGIRIRHTGDIKSKIRDAQRALGLAVENSKQFGEVAENFAKTKLEDEAAYFDAVLDVYLDITSDQLKKGPEKLVEEMGLLSADERRAALRRFEKLISEREDVSEEILNRYDSERCGLNGMRGTLWAGFNAVTEFADHSGLIRYKGADKESRRFESTLYGNEDHLKQVAFQKAVVLLGV